MILIFVLSALFGSMPVTDICHAVRIPARRQVDLRGKAQRTVGGLIIADASCPVFRTKRQKIPSGAIANIAAFATEEIGSHFRAVQPGNKSPLLKVRVQGEIDCRKVDYIVSDDGEDIVGGDGFGPYGLLSCRIREARLLDPRKF